MKRLVLAASVAGTAALGAGVASAGAGVNLHQQDSTQVLRGSFTSVHVTGQLSTLSIASGTQSLATIHQAWNVEEPKLSFSVSHGVLNVAASCPQTLPVTIAVDPVTQDCIDDVALSLPAKTQVVVDTSAGDVSTSHMTAAQKITTELGDVQVLSASAPLLDVVTSEGDLTVRNSTATSLTLASQEGAVTADAVRAGVATLSSESGNISTTLLSKPSSLVISTGEGAVSATVPRGIYNVSTSSQEGKVRVLGLVLSALSHNHIRATSSTGNITVDGD